MVRKLDLLQNDLDPTRDKRFPDNDGSVSTPRILDPFRFLIISLAGWKNQLQLQVIDPPKGEPSLTRTA